MDELDSLAAELQKRRQPLPLSVFGNVRRRLQLDPRARVRRPQYTKVWVLAGATAACSLLAGALLLSPERDVEAPVALLELGASDVEVQHALADGSMIRLEQGARGDLEDLGEAGVRFALERGRSKFKVTPNRPSAFTVTAGKYEVRVLGTEFSVGYDPAGSISIDVQRGVVSVHEAGGDPIRLTAGERFEANGAQPVSVNRPNQLPPEPETQQLPDAENASPEAAAAAMHAAGSSWSELYSKRDYAGALAAARRLGLARLANKLGPVELADLADAARLAGDLPVALATLQALERRFPDAPQARHAGFLIGRVLIQSGRTGEAIPAFERYLAADPDGAYSLETLGRVMELYAEAGDTKRARMMADRYLERAPSGPYRRLARSLVTRR